MNEYFDSLTDFNTKSPYEFIHSSESNNVASKQDAIGPSKTTGNSERSDSQISSPQTPNEMVYASKRSLEPPTLYRVVELEDIKPDWVGTTEIEVYNRDGLNVSRLAQLESGETFRRLIFSDGTSISEVIVKSTKVQLFGIDRFKGAKLGIRTIDEYLICPNYNMHTFNTLYKNTSSFDVIEIRAPINSR